MTNNLIIGLDDQDKYIEINSHHQHLLLIAPTGTGKGVGFVLPNLLSSQDSIIVHDIKLENYILTSGWRSSQGQKIYVFDPLNREGKTHCYNPLDFINKDPDLMIDDIQKIANLLLPENEFWHDHARNLFLSLVLYKAKSIGEIYRMLMSDLVKELEAGIKKHKIHATGIMLINSFLNKNQQEQSGIISTLATALSLWSNPLIDKATSKSDFNPADFRKEKSTLYVGLQPSDIQRLQPLMQFFYQHAAQSLISYTPDQKKEPHGVLFMLDEFPSLGNMEHFITSIPYFGGYRVRALMIIQNFGHLRMSYTDEEVNIILSNSTFKIAFTAYDYETADEVAKIAVDQISSDEIMHLSKDKQILCIDGDHALVTKKLRYFERKELKDRITDPVLF